MKPFRQRPFQGKRYTKFNHSLSDQNAAFQPFIAENVMLLFFYGSTNKNNNGRTKRLEEAENKLWTLLPK